MSSGWSSNQSSRRGRASSRDTEDAVSHDSFLDDNLLGEATGYPSGIGSTETKSLSTAQAPLPSPPLRLPHRNVSNSSYQPTPSSHRLVIALDYGTTFTGVAYATPRSNSAQLTDVETVDYWGPSMGNHSKIPSVYSYSRATGGEEQWGASISQNAVTMVNTKLELDVQDNKIDELELILQVLEGTGNLSLDNIKRAGGYPAYTWKSPEDIVTDYLRKVFEYLDKAISHFTSHLKATIPVDIVITMPVKWSYRAKESTFRAMQRAGFNKATFPRLESIMMVTEPEAAAIYTARHLKEDKSEEFLQLDECFILCDAGGGTVDVISYQVKKLEPNLEFEVVSIPTNAKCGAAYINLEFKRWLKSWIHESNYAVLDPKKSSQKIGSHTTETSEMRQLITAFEAHKKSFSNNSTDMRLFLPAPLDGLNIPGRVKDGQLKITPAIMKHLFESCVDRIIELIESQIRQVEELHRRVKNVFLVGGFGESPYLREELKESLRMRNITIRRPDMRKAWTAVVKGAVLYGIEKTNQRNLVLMTPSPRSYAIVVDENYSGHQFDPRDRYVDTLTNSLKSRKQIAWMIRKGDLVLSEERKVVEKELTLTFPETHNRIFDLPVYAYKYDDDKVPERWETGQFELDELASLRCDLSQFSAFEFDRRQNHTTGQKYHVARLICRMQMSAEYIEVDLHLNMHKVARTEIVVENGNGHEWLGQ